jgi:hypothetical protein
VQFVTWKEPVCKKTGSENAGVCQHQVSKVSPRLGASDKLSDGVPMMMVGNRLDADSHGVHLAHPPPAPCRPSHSVV